MCGKVPRIFEIQTPGMSPSTTHSTLWECRHWLERAPRQRVDARQEPAANDSPPATWRDGAAQCLRPHVHEELQAQQLQQGQRQHTGAPKGTAAALCCNGTRPRSVSSSTSSQCQTRGLHSEEAMQRWDWPCSSETSRASTVHARWGWEASSDVRRRRLGMPGPESQPTDGCSEFSGSSQSMLVLRTK